MAQGTLQVIYEFQSLVAALTGMDVANASMYDGATALAEGALMTVSQPRGRRGSSWRQPFTRRTATSCAPTSRDLTSTWSRCRANRRIHHHGGSTRAASRRRSGLRRRAVPELLWRHRGSAEIAELVHARGRRLVVSTYPVPLGLLQPPGELGADVVAAEGQSLGVPQSYGGPYVGLLAARQSYVRQMPGRLAGLTTDTSGKRGFVLTLQTREQHIRREKATSNICTNQGLMATAATVHMATLGPEGLREVALRCYQNAHYLAEPSRRFPVTRWRSRAILPRVRRLDAGAGRRGRFDACWNTGSSVDSTLALSIRRSTILLLCATETNTRAGIDRLVGLLPR